MLCGKCDVPARIRIPESGLIQYRSMKPTAKATMSANSNAGLPTSPAPVKVIRQSILALFLFAAGVIVGYGLRGAGSASGAAGNINGYPTNYGWGPENAKVTIVEFGDFQCPYCQQWHQEVYSQIRTMYGNTIHFIYRDFPLSFHSDAEPAAEAARCAGAQGRFWDYYDLLYRASQGVDASARRTYAQQLNLDLSVFDQCVQSGRFADAVRQDTLDGGSLGVSGTPAFFINGRLISGAQPFSVFRDAIEAALAS
jgi:protein-disulfide isomerase